MIPRIRFQILIAIATLVLSCASIFALRPKSAAKALPSLTWSLQQSNTTAGLRGIYSVDGKIAWASGTGGAVLKTTDAGQHWQKCTVPGEDGETLDFRGIQAWDENTALVLSAGPGDKSRLYKTTDGCKSWTLLARNDNKDGFWDAIVLQTLFKLRSPNPPFPNDISTASPDTRSGLTRSGILIGDPINGRFDTSSFLSLSSQITPTPGCGAHAGQAAFAASNSSVFVFGTRSYIVGTGGKSGAKVLIAPGFFSAKEGAACTEVKVPMAGGTDSSGIFSLGYRDRKIAVAVGGDYSKPKESKGTAARSEDGGLHWTAAAKPPHGYRSSVAWCPDLKAWIAAGTNGSDISRDDGKTWSPIDDGNWNALSPPFIVGPKGRIARLSSTRR